VKPGWIEDFPGFSSVRVLRTARLEPVGQPTAVVLVGGTCAGKSTLAKALALSSPRWSVAARFTTRPSRGRDELEDTTVVSWAEFGDRYESGTFALAWERPMPDGTAIGYGCIQPSAGTTPIFVAGHGLYTNAASVRPKDALSSALIVGVLAPERVRRVRLKSRSADLDPNLTRALLAHDDQAMLAAADIVVDNYGDHEATAARDFISAVTSIVGEEQ